jgi:hypothetical protein
MWPKYGHNQGKEVHIRAFVKNGFWNIIIPEVKCNLKKMGWENEVCIWNSDWRKLVAAREESAFNLEKLRHSNMIAFL